MNAAQSAGQLNRRIVQIGRGNRGILIHALNAISGANAISGTNAISGAYAISGDSRLEKSVVSPRSLRSAAVESGWDDESLPTLFVRPSARNGHGGVDSDGRATRDRIVETNVTDIIAATITAAYASSSSSSFPQRLQGDSQLLTERVTWVAVSVRPP